MRSLMKVMILLLVGFAVGVVATRHKGQSPSEAATVAEGSLRTAAEGNVRTVAADAAPDAAAQPNGTPEQCLHCTLPDFTRLAAELRDSVVNISTSTKAEPQRGFHGEEFGAPGGGGPQGGGPGDEQDPREFMEPFERFFGPMPRRQLPRRSLGSGFIFDPDGYILTNNHVIENADSVTVKLNSGDEKPAKIIGRDPKTDVAVLKIETDAPLPAISFGDSEAIRVGEWVMAIGNPFGLEFSVTAGIVSAKGRFIGQGNYDDFLQTDAPINPGNSGGPLLDLEGRVIGINTSIFSRSGGNIGIGFAIPINLAKELIPQLREKGRVTRGWMGVMIQKVTPDIAESLGLKHPHGALVADVVKDGPAAKSGVKVGDVIIKFDGKEVKESTELPLMVAREPIGKAVPIVVLRNGEEQSIDLEIAEMADDEVQVAKGEAEAFGLTVQNLTPEIAESLGLARDVSGVLVSAVDPGSAAADAGLRRGDVILEVNRKAVPNVEAYSTQLREGKGAKSVLMLVRRGENTVFLALKPEKETKKD
jgi:serine protease Do